MGSIESKGMGSVGSKRKGLIESKGPGSLECKIPGSFEPKNSEKRNINKDRFQLNLKNQIHLNPTENSGNSLANSPKKTAIKARNQKQKDNT